MLFLYLIFSLALFGLLVAGVLEQRRHAANLDRIPVRVHVNGSRGKSSITRLCAGALRGGGLRVVAKTTGTAARYIHPDASEVAVHRAFDLPNIIEQVGIVARAVTEDPDALVMECMAVLPQLQDISERKLVHSTIGVVSNVREDHLSEMGPTLKDVARSLARTMPRGGVCVTAERALLGVLEAQADKRQCRLIYADPESVSDAELDGFDQFTLKENVAVALAVANEVGVSRRTALIGMYAAPPDPGALTVEHYHVDGKVLRFANVLAANDPASTIMNVQRLLEVEAVRPPIFTLINCRPDRVERNAQMGAIVPELLAEKVFAIGHPTRAALAAVPAGWEGQVFDLGGLGREAESIFRLIVAEVTGEASVVAIGNVHGQGEQLLEHLEGLGALRARPLGGWARL